MATQSGSVADAPAGQLLEGVSGLVSIDASDLREYHLGEGINTLVGNSLGTCITGESRTDENGYVTEAYIKLTESREELFEALNIDAEVAVSYGLANASAKVKFAESFKSSTYSSWLVIRVSVKGPIVSYKPGIAINAQALAMLDQPNGQWHFMRTYGDHFISKIERGGEFTAVMQINSADEHSKRELQVNWEASGSFGKLSASTSGEIKSVTEKTTVTNSLEFRCHVVGPRGLPAALDNKSIVEFALKFPTTVTATEASNLAIVLRDYRTLTTKSLDWPTYRTVKKWSDDIDDAVASLLKKSSKARKIAEQASRYGYGDAKNRRNAYRGITDLIDGDIKRLRKLQAKSLEDFMKDVNFVVPALPSFGDYGSREIPSPGNTVRVPKKVLENVQIIAHDHCSKLRLAARNDQVPEVSSNNPQDTKQIWNILFYGDNQDCVLHVEVNGRSHAIVGMSENDFALKMVPFNDNIDDSNSVWNIHGDPKGQVQIVLVRNHGRPLTIHGGSGWSAGQAVLVYEWGNFVNQHWTIVPVKM